MEEDKCEWRFFLPVETTDKLSPSSLGSFFDEGVVERVGPENRDDIYVVVTEEVGVKRRGDKQRLELKVRTKKHEATVSDGVEGVEVWKKYKIRKKDAVTTGSPLAEAMRLIAVHQLMNEEVSAKLTADPKAEVVVSKCRLNGQYRIDADPVGVQVEDCYLDMGNEQWRSMAVEGTKDRITTFLKTTPLGQRLLNMTTLPGVVATGYPGWVLHIHTTRNKAGPPSQQPSSSRHTNPYRNVRETCKTWHFAMVVCRHPITHKYLAVEETKRHVDPNETFAEGALRETLEEAGIDVGLEGILRVEHNLTAPTVGRMRVVFYATPVDPDAPLKSVADKESVSARWVSVEELEAMRLRGRELLEWGRYLDEGGPIYPLSVFTTEREVIRAPAHKAK